MLQEKRKQLVTARDRFKVSYAIFCQILLYANKLIYVSKTTGIARNFDWEGPKLEKIL